MRPVCPCALLDNQLSHDNRSFGFDLIAFTLRLNLWQRSDPCSERQTPNRCSHSIGEGTGLGRHTQEETQTSIDWVQISLQPNWLLSMGALGGGEWCIKRVGEMLG